MTPQLRHELARVKAAIDGEIETMRGNGGRGESRGPSFLRRRAAPEELPEPQGWAVPIEVPIRGRDGDSKVTVYLSFAAETFDRSEEIIEGLIEEGYPVKAWAPRRDNGDRGGRYGGGDRGGYGDRDRGGWRDRGGYGDRDRGSGR